MAAAALLLTLPAGGQIKPSPQPATTSAPAAPPAADLQATLLANSTALFTAFQRRNVLGFLAGITPDFTYIGPEGVLSIEAQAGTVEDCKLESYSVSAPQLHTLTAESAVLIYRHQQDASCNGKPLPRELIGTDVYVRRDGRWLISLHTETVPK